MRLGKVYLVGAGPGDPGLLTVRGAALLRTSDVVVADRLVPAALLETHVAPHAELFIRPPRSELEQERVTQLLIERAQAGARVVRLKGGDPFLFGRGSEEAEALRAAGIPFEVVPGVTAALAVPAYAGIPLTHRGLAATVVFATGHETEHKDGGQLDWTALAQASTLVLYMSVGKLGELMRRLVEAGRPPTTPVAVVEQGTTAAQRTIVGTLADVATRAHEARIRPPALTIVGEVVALRDRIAWFESRPLHGQRLLLLSSRPPESPTDSGVEIDWVAPLSTVVRQGELEHLLSQLSRFRALALVSRHAVEALLDALWTSGRDVRALAHLQLAAVGEATAAALAAVRLRADLIGQDGGAALGRAMIAAGWTGPTGVVGARGGRTELEEALGAAGAEAVRIDAYETHANLAALERVAARHRRSPYAAIGFTSPRGAAAAMASLGGPTALRSVLVGAIGATTEEALSKTGVEVAVVPARPDIEMLARALCDALAARSKIG